MLLEVVVVGGGRWEGRTGSTIQPDWLLSVLWSHRHLEARLIVQGDSGDNRSREQR